MTDRSNVIISLFIYSSLLCRENSKLEWPRLPQSIKLKISSIALADLAFFALLFDFFGLDVDDS
jgi:hypothetical protein